MQESCSTLSTSLPRPSMTNTKQITFPQFIGNISDYHEFAIIVDTLRAFGMKGVKFTETGYDCGYGAVFYLQKDAEYRRLLKLHTTEDTDNDKDI
jgi:hypothetical protein